MSYEGYEQCICESGHYYERGCYDEDRICEVCQRGAAWGNPVDTTNDDPGQGLIPVSALKTHFLLTEEVVETCNLGHAHITKPAIYRIPELRECDSLRVFEIQDDQNNG